VQEKTKRIGETEDKWREKKKTPISVEFNQLEKGSEKKNPYGGGGTLGRIVSLTSGRKSRVERAQLKKTLTRKDLPESCI